MGSKLCMSCNKSFPPCTEKCSECGKNLVYLPSFGDEQLSIFPPDKMPDLLKDYEIKDSGNRTNFETGAVRDITENKGRFDLLPYEALERLAIHCEKGAKNYGEGNVELGIPINSLVNSAIRHLFKFVRGWADEDHLAAAFWNIAWIFYTERLIEEGKIPKSFSLRTVGSGPRKE